MNFTDKSACHQAPVKAYNGSEGTKNYMCTKCRKACDLLPLNEWYTASFAIDEDWLRRIKVHFELPWYKRMFRRFR